MTEYETICIVRPDWTTEQVRQLSDRVAAIIERHKGVLFHLREVGRRRLAYRVHKQTKGLYLYCNYGGTGSIVADVERALRLEEGVLKFLTVRMGVVESVDARRAKTLEEEVRLAHLFGAGSDAPVPPLGHDTESSMESSHL